MKKSMDLKQLFAEASGLAGKSVTVCGWVKTIRSSKAIGFIELNDGTCFKNLQIVFEEDKVSNFADIAKIMGLPGRTNEQLTNSLVQAIKDLNKQLNIPLSYKEYGVTEEKFNETVDFIAENAVLDPCTASNPRETDVAQMKKILTCTYYGNDVTF